MVEADYLKFLQHEVDAWQEFRRETNNLNLDLSDSEKIDYSFANFMEFLCRKYGQFLDLP